jgi:nucleoside-diphosphate-sugar epimerase
MRIVVTGASGFIGRALVARLRGAGHDVVGTDWAGTPDVPGDIADSALHADLFTNACDAVVHLATVPGGAAEQDPVAARRINLDATMALAEAAGAAGARFVFASSIAVFGDPLPPHVNDATPLAPTLLYGAHKAMAEQWLATLDRRGALSALALRLPGIVARPPGPSGMKSAFMSEVFHALAARRRFVSPVSPDATMWLMSVGQVADNLAHAVAIDATGAVTLPALRVTMGALVAAIARATGADPALISYEPDPALEAGFGRLPPLTTQAAEAMGFVHDGTLADLVLKGLNV